MLKGIDFSSLFGTDTQATGTIGLELVNCCSCGTPFGIERTLRRALLSNGKTFYCPNGHSNVYSGDSEADRLKKQLAQEAKKREGLETSLRYQREENDRLVRSRRAVKGQVTRLRNKIAEGKCPCCDQFFPDLHSHMTAAHPDFEATEPEETADEQ